MKKQFSITQHALTNVASGSPAFQPPESVAVVTENTEKNLNFERNLIFSSPRQDISISGGLTKSQVKRLSASEADMPGSDKEHREVFQFVLFFDVRN